MAWPPALMTHSDDLVVADAGEEQACSGMAMISALTKIRDSRAMESVGRRDGWAYIARRDSGRATDRGHGRSPLSRRQELNDLLEPLFGCEVERRVHKSRVGAICEKCLDDLCLPAPSCFRTYSRPSTQDQFYDLGLIVLVSPPTQRNVAVVLPERDIRPVLSQQRP